MAIKMMSKLDNGGILAHLRKMKSMEEERYRYFHYDSKLWRAIKDYFGVVDPRDNPIVMKALAGEPIALDQIGAVIWHRGTGISIRLDSVSIYDPSHAAEKTEIPTLHFKANVEFCNIYAASPEESGIYRDISFSVPASLEESFSKQAFDKWLATMKAEVTAVERKLDMAEVARLKKKYPEVFK